MTNQGKSENFFITSSERCLYMKMGIFRVFDYHAQKSFFSKIQRFLNTNKSEEKMMTKFNTFRLSLSNEQLEGILFKFVNNGNYI